MKTERESLRCVREGLRCWDFILWTSARNSLQGFRSASFAGVEAQVEGFVLFTQRL